MFHYNATLSRAKIENIIKETLIIIQKTHTHGDANA